MGYDTIGFEDNRQYTEKELKKEGWSQAAIWICLSVFMALCVFLVAFLNIQELKLKHNGTAVTAEHEQGASSVTILDEKGNKYYIDVTDPFVGKLGSKVTVYYAGDNIGAAKPLSSLKTWVMFYAIAIAALAFCIRGIYKNIHQNNKHAVMKE